MIDFIPYILAVALVVFGWVSGRKVESARQTRETARARKRKAKLDKQMWRAEDEEIIDILTDVDDG